MRVEPQSVRWHVYPCGAALRVAAVQFIEDRANAAIARYGSFGIVLAGGETPRALYENLARIETDWSAWRIYFGDERCLPEGDPQRNSTMADSAWLQRVGLPSDRIYRIPAELGARAAAAKYAQTLRAVGDFDLVLLGLGEDGHTASLFPPRAPPSAGDNADVVAVEDAPKPPRERVTLSAKRLSRARHVAFVVSGEGKRDAVRRWRADEAIPARSITPPNGVDVFIDAAAWSGTLDPRRRRGG